MDTPRPVRFPVIGGIYTWHSAKGYTLPDGERCEVYQINKAMRRVAINIDGDTQTPEGYSMSTSFDELFPIN
jgi:hypothetical protein